MRYTEYVLAAFGIAIIGVLLMRAIPSMQTASEPPPPAEKPTLRLDERLRPNLEKLFAAAAPSPDKPHLDGQVISEDGTPIPNATISVTSNRDETEKGTSSDTGAFSMKPPLPAQELSFRVEAPGYASIPLEPANGVVALTSKIIEGLQLILERESTVSGMVVDEQGVPLRSVPVYLYTPADPWDLERIRLDANAEFTIRGLNAGDYLFRFRYYGTDSTEADQGFTLQRGESLTGLRVLAPASLKNFIVSGIVTDPQNKPIPDVELHSPRSDYSVQTDDQGRFSILVTNFPVVIYATHAGYSRSNQNFDAMTNSAHIVLGPPAFISGRVLYASDGKPVPKFKIAGQYVESKDGRFTNVACSAGATAIGAQANGLPLTYVPLTPPLKHGETREIEFRLPPGRQFEGRVVDGWGHPVPLARVSLHKPPAGTEGYQGMAVGIEDTTSYDGGFLLGPFADGPVELLVDSREHKRETFTVDVSPNMQIAVLQLKRRHTLHVQVTGFAPTAQQFVRVGVFPGTNPPSVITQEMVFGDDDTIIDTENLRNGVAKFLNTFESGTYTAVVFMDIQSPGQTSLVIASQQVEIPGTSRNAITVQMNVQGVTAVKVEK